MREPLRATGCPSERPAPRRGAARQHARLPLRVRRRRADRRARSSGSTTPAGASTCSATSSTPHCGLVITEPRHVDAARADRRRPAAGARVDPLRRRDDPAPRSAHRSTTRSPRCGADDPGLEPDVDAIWALIFTVGHVGRAEGGDLLAAAAARHRQPHGDDHGPRPRRRRLRVHAAVPLERGAGRMGAVARRRRARSGSAAGSRRRAGCRRPPLRRDLLQLHRASRSRTCSRSPSSPTTPTTRCASRSATRVRREVVDDVRPPVRRRGDRRVRRDRGRRRGQPRRRAAAPARSGSRRRRRAGRRRGRQREAARRLRRRTAALAQRRGVRRRDRQHRRVSGPFEGYYNNAEATAKTTRNGWYWSGDLGYIDADGYLYFAGRNADWIRVDGENFPAGPIEEALRAHARRRARRGLRRARRPGRRPGDGGLVLARRRGLRPGRVRGVARRAGRRSGRSGGRATCACCAIRRPPARTRS